MPLGGRLCERSSYSAENLRVQTGSRLNLQYCRFCRLVIAASATLEFRFAFFKECLDCFLMVFRKTCE